MAGNVYFRFFFGNPDKKKAGGSVPPAFTARRRSVAGPGGYGPPG